MRENIVVLDFGGQYNQLIARRVRECQVYCEVHPYTIDIETLKRMDSAIALKIRDCFK